MGMGLADMIVGVTQNRYIQKKSPLARPGDGGGGREQNFLCETGIDTVHYTGESGRFHSARGLAQDVKSVYAQKAPGHGSDSRTG